DPANFISPIYFNGDTFPFQRWAEQPVDGHDCKAELVGFSAVTHCSRVPGYDAVGQNYALLGDGGPISSANWQKAIDEWIGEVKDVVAPAMTSNGGVIGHYTQVVWYETREVGCGVFTNNQKCAWVDGWNNFYCAKYICNYGPAGNMVDKNRNPLPPYSTTVACKKPSTNYPGLCAE
ncbi:venom allergen 5.02-like, partial [Hyalella azteca]|uniref:Venom allergen 5.02-like n=1 Tax=Hyalella azteca TaxID=294128 RepID=A0A8B7NXM5_HYAAZ